MFSLKLKPLLFFFISLSFIISVCCRANGMNASAAQMKAAKKLQSDLSNLESDLAQAQGLSINTIKEMIKTAQGFPQKKITFNTTGC